MILLLEGCNATGKTSFASRLSEVLGWPVLKCVAPRDDAYNYFYQRVEYFDDEEKHFIIDRCHLSNWAYGDSEGGAVMNFDEWLRLDWWLRELGTWLFLMVGDPMEIAHRTVVRGCRSDHQGLRRVLDAPEAAALQQRFIEAYELSQIEIKGTFDYSTFLQEEHFNHLVSEIRKASQ